MELELKAAYKRKAISGRSGATSGKCVQELGTMCLLFQ